MELSRAGQRLQGRHSHGVRLRGNGGSNGRVIEGGTHFSPAHHKSRMRITTGAGAFQRSVGLRKDPFDLHPRVRL